MEYKSNVRTTPKPLKTYRQEFEFLKPNIGTDNKTTVSTFITMLYSFLSWLVKTTNRQPGYMTYMSQNKNPMNIIDILHVLINCIDDNECYLTIEKKQKDMILKLKKIATLILEHLDDSIRTDPHLIYDEETDDEDPLLQENMMDSIFAIIPLIIDYEKIDSENK